MSPSLSQSIEAYREGCQLLRSAVSGMTTEQVRIRPVPGRWSTLEVVCHLVDSEQAWCHRMKRVIGEDLPLLIGYDETRLAASLGYQDREIEAELALFEATRLQMATILQGIAEDSWSRAGVHDERGLVTLREMLQIETDHVLHHVRHIDEKRKALGLAAVGPA